MDYSTDRPINKSEEDLLGRASFSKYLGEAIYKYKGSDGLVIGLFGKWGTGKTSIINMAKEEIEKQSENDENRPIIMDFSPWNYSDKNDLISLFFQSLKSKFDLEKNEKLEKDFGEALSNYAEAFELLSIVPMFGSGLAKLLKIIAKSEGNNLMKIPDLDSTKKKLEEKLRDSEQKIIIVIDDIDRLTNPQIRDIFQLVKQVANFPDIIYILSMDREVVSRALEEVHNIDGNQYLEKIIQLQFEIPELRKYKLRNIFLSKLDKIIKEFSCDIIWQPGYWYNIFENCIEPYIKTLRDVNRVINTFSFRYGMLYKETSLEDLIAITTIEVLEPKLYKWIFNNRISLCGYVDIGISTNSNEEKHREEYKKVFKGMDIEPEKAIKCISTMFPRFAKDIGEQIVIMYTDVEIRGKMRIADSKKFNLYFSPNLDEIKISMDIIKSCINNLEFDEIRKIIDKINSDGNFKYFIGEIEYLIPQIPYGRLDLIANILICIQGELEKNITYFPFDIMVHDNIEKSVIKIIERLETTSERYDTIKNAFENISENGLATIAILINDIDKISISPIFEKKELQDIKHLYVKRIRNLASSDSLFEIPRFNVVFELWNRLDKDGVKEYMSKLIVDEVKTLKFICYITWKWYGKEGNGWGLESDLYSEYIPDEEIYNLIQGFAKQNLDKFSELELIKLATFVLNYGKENRKYGANEEQASKLVEEWKQSK
jgi:P-loop ATPase